MTDPERAGSPVTRRGPKSSSSCTPTTSSLGAVANTAIARWSLTLGTKVSPARAGLCLFDLKMGRLARDPKHLGSIVDVADYAACLHEVMK